MKKNFVFLMIAFLAIAFVTGCGKKMDTIVGPFDPESKNEQLYGYQEYNTVTGQVEISETGKLFDVFHYIVFAGEDYLSHQYISPGDHVTMPWEADRYNFAKNVNDPNTYFYFNDDGTGRDDSEMDYTGAEWVNDWFWPWQEGQTSYPFLIQCNYTANSWNDTLIVQGSEVFYECDGYKILVLNGSDGRLIFIRLFVKDPNNENTAQDAQYPDIYYTVFRENGQFIIPLNQFVHHYTQVTFIKGSEICDDMWYYECRDGLPVPTLVNVFPVGEFPYQWYRIQREPV